MGILTLISVLTSGNQLKNLILWPIEMYYSISGSVSPDYVVDHVISRIILERGC